jgi:hypothetical protein
LRESSVALHTIAALPLDPQFALFRHYPAMKLGARNSIAFFVRLLLPRAREILAQAPEAEWVVSVPPLFVLPAAANLLARALCRELAARPAGPPPRLVELRYSAPDPATLHRESPAADYSRASLAERAKHRQQLYEGRARLAIDADVFRGRPVLFVNDINVTGTQQHFMRRAIAPAGPASLHWLHVLQVDPELGRSHPELEYALNHLHLASFDEFAELVAGSEIDHTARCVDRLLGHGVDELAPVLRRMGRDRAQQLLALAADEAAWNGARADHASRIAELTRRLADDHGGGSM